MELEQAGLNRQGLGARIELVADGRRQQRQMQSGYGYSSQVGARVYFGLGAAVVVDTLRVIWPDGKGGVQLSVDADQLLRLKRADLITAVLDEEAGLPGAFGRRLSGAESPAFVVEMIQGSGPSRPLKRCGGPRDVKRVWLFQLQL